MLYGEPKAHEELLKSKGMTAASAVYPTYRGGPAGFGQGPPTLPPKDFRNRFIIAKDEVNFNSLERKWSPDRPCGEKSSTRLNLGQIKFCKLQVANIQCFFGATGHFCPAFCPQIRALGGEFVPARKKFPQHFSQKLLILLTLPYGAAATVPL